MIRHLVATLVISAIIAVHMGRGGDSVRIDQDLLPHVQSFLQKAKVLKVEFGTSGLDVRLRSGLPEKILGQCRYFYKRIEISSKYWPKLNHCYREQLIYHELGHCLLGQINHDDTDINIMNASNFISCDFYTAHYNFFIHKLFKKDSRKSGVTFEWH